MTYRTTSPTLMFDASTTCNILVASPRTRTVCSRRSLESFAFCARPIQSVHLTYDAIVRPMALFMFVKILAVDRTCGAQDYKCIDVRKKTREMGFSSCFVIVKPSPSNVLMPDAGDALAVLLAQPHQSPAVRPPTDSQVSYLATTCAASPSPPWCTVTLIKPFRAFLRTHVRRMEKQVRI